MKSEQVIHGLCARCGTEVKDVYPKFFLPAPKTNGKVRSSATCVDCFAAYIESLRNDDVRMVPPPPPKRWVCQRCGAELHQTGYPLVCARAAGGCDRLTDRFWDERGQRPAGELTAFREVLE